MNDFLKEKELLLNSIENNTTEHWKNYYKDIPIECIYDDLVIDINEIKRLQQENKELKEENFKLQARSDRVINNWNKLKEWLQERKFVYNITGEDLDEDTSITEVLVKMCEIEKGWNE